MSVIAFINVHQCNGCKRVVVLKDDFEYTNFNQTWYTGFECHFCPVCRGKAKSAKAIEEDQVRLRRIAQAIEAERAKKLEVEYAH